MTPRPTVVLVDGNPFQRGQNEAALRRVGYDTVALAEPSQARSRPYAMRRLTDEVTRLLDISPNPDSDECEDERATLYAGAMAMSGSTTDEPSRLPASQRLQ